jgi:uncharacterized protein
MELRTIPVPGAESETFIIYRPLIGLAFIGNRGLVDLIYQVAEAPQTALRPDIAQFLQTIGFTQSDPPAPEPPQGDFDPLGVTLLLTNQCQLRCTYCYAAAGEFPRQVLPLEYGRLAIDYAVEAALRRGAARLDLALHGGGEPTLTWKRLVSLADYARQKPIPVSLSLTSNGMWSRTQTAWILANVDAVTLSMDGSPETQNRQRPLASGRPSSDRVMRTIGELDSHAFPYTIRMTALPPWDDLAGDVGYLCKHTRCANFHVEPAFNTRRGEECGPQGDDGQGFARAFMAAFQIAASAGRRLIYSGAALENVTASFCSSGYSSLIVTPEGSLVACYTATGNSHPLAPYVTIGRIHEGQICIDEAARARLGQALSERRQACRACFCYWSCAGDCFAKFLTPGHGGHLVFDGRCEINRSLLRDLMLQRMARSNGIWMRYSPWWCCQPC